ncbi:hypothetical protein [Gemmata sp.]|uniref:hypothetical protein n=1 Tax=Gemmata sp. TaxID=1914242 RepID=UPI003F6F4DAA
MNHRGVGGEKAGRPAAMSPRVNNPFGAGDHVHEVAVARGRAIQNGGSLSVFG